MRPSLSRAGATLLELAIALVIIGMGSTVAMLASRRQDTSESGSRSAVTRLAYDARRRAIASGQVQRVTFRLATDGAVLDADDTTGGSVVRHLVAFPDGTVIADTSLARDDLDERSVGRRERAP